MAKLGSGALDEVLGELSGMGATDKQGALHLLLSEITPDPEQPRRFSDTPDEGLQDLANSILRHGVIQPITVRREGSGYQIVAGERRWRASQIALQSGQKCHRKGYDLSRIPAVIVEPESSLDRLEMQMVENLAREDMSDTDTAQALRSLYEQLGVSYEELGKRLGKSKAWVSNMLVRTKPEAQQVAECLGLELDAMGKLELAKLSSYWRDPDKNRIVHAVAQRLQQGDTFSRALLEEEDARYDLEKRLDLVDRGLSLDDLRDLDRESKRGNDALVTVVREQEQPDLEAARNIVMASKVQEAIADNAADDSKATLEDSTADSPAPVPATQPTTPPAPSPSPYALQDKGDDVDMDFGTDGENPAGKAMENAGGLGAELSPLEEPVYAVAIPTELAMQILAKAGKSGMQPSSATLREALETLFG